MRCSNSNAYLASALLSELKCFIWLMCPFFACVAGPICFTKVLLVAVPTRHAVYRALTIKGWTEPFPFRSLSPIVRKGFKNDLILWSFKHLCSFSATGERLPDFVNEPSMRLQCFHHLETSVFIISWFLDVIPFRRHSIPTVLCSSSKKHTLIKHKRSKRP